MIWTHLAFRITGLLWGVTGGFPAQHSTNEETADIFVSDIDMIWLNAEYSANWDAFELTFNKPCPTGVQKFDTHMRGFMV